MPATRGSREDVTEEAAWKLLLALAARAKRGDPAVGPASVDVHGASADGEAAAVFLDEREPRGWRGAQGGSVEALAARLLDLYVPLCVGAAAKNLVVGHLGQSLDGRIATESGVSQFITGEQNVEHAHRMRALFDAVLVGARTVEEDDPRLTTRRVPGAHPTRVILDPSRRLGEARAVFRDEKAPTLLVCRASAAAGATRHGAAEILAVEEDAGGDLPPARVVEALRRRGLGRIFIEGGGVTVSRFLREGVLDRLQVAVAPVILGSGRPAFSLPVIETLDDALTLSCDHFVTGPDVLFDCDLKARSRDS
jgi:diaminohydroxyphosphoribosylaminopyrimidine deaminase / 5-amino-6-(5-phosphoribosylamino)uracil reductase